MTAAEFKAAFPAFTSTPDATVTRNLATAAREVDATRWGDDYDRGLGLMTAHLIITESRDVAEGGSYTSLSHDNSITTKQAGSPSETLSITRNAEVVQAMVDNPLLSTRYGQQFRRLARVVGAGSFDL